MMCAGLPVPAGICVTVGADREVAAGAERARDALALQRVVAGQRITINGAQGSITL